MTGYSIAEDKKQLRKKFRNIRAGISQSVKDTYARSFSKILIESDLVRQANLVLSYVSINTEANTRVCIERLLEQGYRVACPRSNVQNHTLEFLEIHSMDELVVGAYDIPEPAEDAYRCTKEELVGSICIVPGLAFDRYGGRLGYGGGFYDRFLMDYPGTTLGLTYQSCIVSDKLPLGPYDQTVDYVACECGLFPCLKTW